MSFNNLQIDETELPRAEALELKPMAEQYVPEVRFQQWLIWPVIIVLTAIPAIVVVNPEKLRTVFMFLPLVPGLLAAWLWPLAVAQARVKRFALREHDIALRTGVFFQKTIILPLSRVQHAEVSEGPLQRRFGLASLKLFTAGGTSVDLQIDGLEKERAEKLREFILKRAETDERA